METCQDCEKKYSTIYTIPNEVWVKITPKLGEAGLLCIECADKRAAKIGINLYWNAGIDKYPKNQIGGSYGRL